ncbi:MAG: hypothetical protein WAK82_27545 [Streptosporangiaceae bacterium]
MASQQQDGYFGERRIQPGKLAIIPMAGSFGGQQMMRAAVIDGGEVLPGRIVLPWFTVPLVCGALIGSAARNEKLRALPHIRDFCGTPAGVRSNIFNITTLSWIS